MFLYYVDLVLLHGGSPQSTISVKINVYDGAFQGWHCLSCLLIDFQLKATYIVLC